ncbi:MAG TPA: patatin-like phospholipase family protein [Acidimicrobiales bacterium]|nr:patatin-like phospholipase family protein [Acidimicrobiales bacterium]
MSIGQLPRPVGYVFGGGGSRGAVQVGMLQALAEQQVAPDLVAGTSVGAINGAVVALDPTSAANRLSHLWPRVTRSQVFPGGLLAQIRTLEQTRTHLFPNAALESLITQFLGSGLSFDDTAVPFGLVTTDTATGHAHPIRSGELLPALLASAAIPGIFPVVEHDGLRLCDGGVVANVPMELALTMGARSLVVLDCDPAGCLPGPQTNLAEVFLVTIMMAMRAQAAYVAARVATEVPVVYLPCSTTRLVSPLDFGHTEELIETGYEMARSFLATLEVTGPGLYGLQLPWLALPQGPGSAR